MTKAEMRVKIAQDVLAQIRAKKIVPTEGVYLFAPDAKTAPELKKSQCEACAIGSMFMAKLPNKVSCLRAAHWDYGEPSWGL